MDIPGVPQIPTDNLYKFVSLSGILMLLVGFAVPPVTRYRAMQADLALIAWYRAEIAQRARGIDQLSRSIGIVEAANQQAFAGSREQAADAINKADAVADSAREVADSAEQRDVETRRQAVEGDREFFARFVLVGYGLAFVGILLATWGFWNWYIKLQKPMDEIIRRDAESRRDRISASL